VRVTLKTSSLEIARERRDAIEAADDAFSGGRRLKRLIRGRVLLEYRRTID
jgi:hypothetical protein